MPEKTAVLFVCLGNICRSTMAEGIFRHQAQKPEWKDKIGRIDSCGTGTFFSFLFSPRKLPVLRVVSPERAC